MMSAFDNPIGPLWAFAIAGVLIPQFHTGRYWQIADVKQGGNLAWVTVVRIVVAFVYGFASFLLFADPSNLAPHPFYWIFTVLYLLMIFGYQVYDEMIIARFVGKLDAKKFRSYMIAGIVLNLLMLIFAILHFTLPAIGRADWVAGVCMSLFVVAFAGNVTIWVFVSKSIGDNNPSRGGYSNLVVGTRVPRV